jgi:hypothetical protein
MLTFPYNMGHHDKVNGTKPHPSLMACIGQGGPTCYRTIEPTIWKPKWPNTHDHVHLGPLWGLESPVH